MWQGPLRSVACSDASAGPMSRLLWMQDTWLCHVFTAHGRICSMGVCMARSIPLALGSPVSFTLSHESSLLTFALAMSSLCRWRPQVTRPPPSLCLGVLVPIKKMASSMRPSALHPGTLFIPSLGSPSLVPSHSLGLTSGAISLVGLLHLGPNLHPALPGPYQLPFRISVSICFTQTACCFPRSVECPQAGFPSPSHRVSIFRV